MYDCYEDGVEDDHDDVRKGSKLQILWLITYESYKDLDLC